MPISSSTARKTTCAREETCQTLAQPELRKMISFSEKSGFLILHMSRRLVVDYIHTNPSPDTPGQ